MTSLVVPRPIAWVSSRSKSGVRNLAPFSYFAGVSATPMLVAISVGARGERPKDTLRNVRERESFCINVVTEPQIDLMNGTSGDYGADVDEFAAVGVEAAEGEEVDAPYVADCPAVMECRLWKDVPLPSDGALLLGEVVALHLSETLEMVEGTKNVDTRSLRPVGRLWGPMYSLLGPLRELVRPRV